MPDLEMLMVGHMQRCGMYDSQLDPAVFFGGGGAEKLRWNMCKLQTHSICVMLGEWCSQSVLKGKSGGTGGREKEINAGNITMHKL